jgi:mannose-6-phosphate isomerase-like protein (cupin superfamily)
MTWRSRKLVHGVQIRKSGEKIMSNSSSKGTALITGASRGIGAADLPESKVMACVTGPSGSSATPSMVNYLHVLILRVRWIAAAFLAWNVLIGVYTAAASDEGSKFPDVKSDLAPTYVQGPAGEIFTFLKTGRSTCGTYVMADGVIPPGAGPFPHVHHFTDEWFYFPDGGLTIEMGVREYPDINIIPGKNAPKDHLYLYNTRPGDIVYGPRYIIHGFHNRTNKSHRLVVVWSPADKPGVDITDYFLEAGQVLTDPKNPPPIGAQNKELFVTIAPKYGINQSSSLDEYVSATSYEMPKMDNHYRDLVKLLAPDAPDAAPRHCR